MHRRSECVFMCYVNEYCGKDDNAGNHTATTINSIHWSERKQKTHCNSLLLSDAIWHPPIVSTIPHYEIFPMLVTSDPLNVFGCTTHSRGECDRGSTRNINICEYDKGWQSIGLKKRTTRNVMLVYEHKNKLLKTIHNIILLDIDK